MKLKDVERIRKQYSFASVKMIPVGKWTPSTKMEDVDWEVIVSFGNSHLYFREAEDFDFLREKQL